MKTALTLESDSKEKIELLISLAKEMGMVVEPQPGMAAEPSEPYSRKQPLKAAFIAEASSKHKLDALLKVAKELGIRLSPLSDERLEDMLLAENSLREEWLAPENDHWDEFLRSHKID